MVIEHSINSNLGRGYDVRGAHEHMFTDFWRTQRGKLLFDVNDQRLEFKWQLLGYYYLIGTFAAAA